MQKITTEELLKELQELDARIVIAPNANRPGASNILLNGIDICPWVHSTEIQSEHSSDYTYLLPNDTRVPFKTIDEIKEIVKLTIDRMNTDKEYSDLMTGNEGVIEEEVYGEHKA